MLSKQHCQKINSVCFNAECFLSHNGFFSSYPYLVIFDENELDMLLSQQHSATSIQPRQVFTVPGMANGVFVLSAYNLGSNTLLGIAFVSHTLPDDSIIPLPDTGQVSYNEGMDLFIYIM